MGSPWHATYVFVFALKRVSAQKDLKFQHTREVGCREKIA